MSRSQGLIRAPEKPRASGVAQEQRADLCLLAAHLMLRELDGDALDVLRAEGVASVLDRLAPGCAGHLERDWDEQAFDLEAAEYCRLFLLPGGVSPYAGVWLEGEQARRLVLAESEASATALGFTNHMPDGLPADHLGVLLALVAEAWRVSDSAGEPATSLSSSLFDGWLARFLDSLAQRARSPLYRALAGLIEVVVAETDGTTAACAVDNDDIGGQP